MATRVLFVHGLWIHARAWDPWLDLFRSAGFEAEAPGWPGDGETVTQTRQQPQRVAGYGVREIADHFTRIARLGEPPIVIGHSFGGLIAQKLLASGAAQAAVAIDPAPIKGVKALPFAQVWSALPVLRRKANRDRAVMLSRRQFRYRFGNAISREESDQLYDRWAIPGPGRPIFDLTAAKKDPTSPIEVDLDDRNRGRLLVIGGGRDHTIPEVVARQAAELYRPGGNTEYRKFDDRGHSLVFDSGWREVAQPVLDWVRTQTA
ncbi:alpha/beta hydrolase [Micromonospora purpureochromogenes]|uniref:alpha/beta hydrolase n=1 Tax=Micromonospora purpureochromogenes TaxID=47872 RepID=UPI0036358A9B